MKIITSELIINAKPELIWSILMDFAKYPDWNPFIKSISGNAAAGNKITVQIHPPGSSPMTFKPTVLTLEKDKEFRWLGHLLVPGIFDGEHKLELIANADGSTLFRQSESFKGILVPLINKMLENNTFNGFKLMNIKLKELAEFKA